MLGTSDRYYLYWKPGANATDNIIFEAQVRTKGWIGLGFSPNGAMAGSDIVIMWIDKNGQPHISVHFTCTLSVLIKLRFLRIATDRRKVTGSLPKTPNKTTRSWRLAKTELIPSFASNESSQRATRTIGGLPYNDY